MNRFLKYVILFCAVTVLLSGQSGFAQLKEKKSVALEVTASVMPEIQLTTIRDISMEDVESNTTILHISPLTDVNAGLMLATGQPNAQIRLNYMKRLEMIRTDGPGQLTVVYEVSVYTSDNQRASRLFETVEEALRLSDTGKIYIWVGGEIDLTKAYPGNYEGEFTIEIEYI